MKKKPIFIHSLFRTGSTYVWSKFRRQEAYCCYYEPFHQEMANLEHGKIDIWGYDKSCTQWMRHPDLDVGYLREYERLLEPGVKGVPYFKKSFSFDDFFNNGENPDQKKYIDFLLESAGEKTPVLQFNRSAGRIEWFKRNYPDALHIYLVRNPVDQFHSYLDMYEKNKLDSFLTMDLIITGVNRLLDLIQLPASRIPLFEFHSDLFLDEKFVYSRLLSAYSIEEKYYIFYFIWLVSLIENALNADFLLDIGLLSTDTSYRAEAVRFFENEGIGGIDFDDARIRTYEEPVLKKREMAGIEETVQSLIQEQYPPDRMKCVYVKLGPKKRRSVGFDREKLRYWGIKKMNKKKGFNKELVKKYEFVFTSFSEQLAERNRIVQLLKNQLKNETGEVKKLKEALEQKERELSQKNETLAEKDRLLERSKQTLAQKDRHILEEDEALAQRDRQLVLKDRELKQKEYRLESLSGEKAALEGELSGKNKEIDSLRSQLSRITGNKYFKTLEFLRLVKTDKN